MQDIRVVAEHVSVARGKRAHAEIVLLAVPRAERRIEQPDRVDQFPPDVEAEAHARGQARIRRHGRACERRPDRFRIVAVHPGRCSRRIAGTSRSPHCWRTASRSRCGGPDAAQRASAVSQPFVTRVSELSSTTSARESRMPRFAVTGTPGSDGCAAVRRSAARAASTRRSRRRSPDPATRRRSAPVDRGDRYGAARSRRSARPRRRRCRRE